MEEQAREEPEQVHRRRQRTRVAIFGVIGALDLGAAGYLLLKAFWGAHLVKP